jgi:hydroxymethylpyrimidine/phosphomethylpyrimidine kinase
MRGRVLIVAGSDSGGGAGIQGDIKTVTALTGYAATAITALTAQNTLGVFGIHSVPVDFIALQMRLVLEDIGADAIKTGMLHNAEVIETVAGVIEDMAGDIPLVVDPVMVAKGGAPLLDPDAAHALQRLLLPRADIITPNIPEAQALSGVEIHDLDDMRHAASLLLTFGPKAVLLKGGHMEGETVIDLLLTNDGEEVFTSRRIETVHTHGTGCTLASGIATGLAQRLTLPEAVARARNFVDQAIRQAPGYGKGHGPLNHTWTVADGF